MTSPVTVRGLSWAHPRGHAPLVAAADVWTDSGAGELADHVGRYDLVTCDHPLIGRAAVEGWLEPLDEMLDPAVLAGLRDRTVGASFDSYRYGGRVWAVDAAVDAATDPTRARHLGEAGELGRSGGWE